ncbi:hypothetical protein [Thiomicrorhabdus arctica]|uniref:hypothetical protein n=1 Tax=Thiomicrorhabdus arctica TaxID=131540 RepID=UPI00037D10F4|nr:hypothetical protein [Thiomicrorhabdus arctica]
MSNLSNYFSDPIIQRFLKRVVILLVLLMSLSALTWYGYEEVTKELNAQEKPKILKLNSLQSQVRFLQQQVKLYEQYGEKYEELIKKGLVKKQDRVFWTDSLIRLTDEYLIPNLKFSFSAEKTLGSGQFSHINIPNGLFFFSRVELNMDLQHEEDLLRVLETINQKISPLYLVESCKTQLKDSDHKVNANFDLLQGNVSASCSLIVFHTHPSQRKK